MDEYGRIASLYDPLVGPALRPVHRAMVGLLHEAGVATVADLCCGTGLLTGLAARSGLIAMGVDLSAGMLAVAERKRPQAEYVRADATALPLPDRAFDAAAISFALHEKPGDTAVSILAEARRVVREQGCIIVADYLPPGNGHGLLTGLSINLVERLAGRDHHGCFREYMARGGAEGLFARAGLTGRCVARLLSGWVGLYVIG